VLGVGSHCLQQSSRWQWCSWSQEFALQLSFKSWQVAGERVKQAALLGAVQGAVQSVARHVCRHCPSPCCQRKWQYPENEGMHVA
jgi:hypothetical protein